MKSRSSLILGIILIVLAAILIAAYLVPELGLNPDVKAQWPLIVVGLGLLTFGAGLGNKDRRLVSGAIMTGIGGILFYQNQTGDWKSWAYLWALIPGFAGIGHLLQSLLRRRGWVGLRRPLRLIVTSLLLLALMLVLVTSLVAAELAVPIVLGLIGIWLVVGNLLSR